MKHRYDRKIYSARNLSHSFIIVIHEKLGIPARAWDFQFVTSAPENMISGVLLHLSISNHWSQYSALVHSRNEVRDKIKLSKNNGDMKLRKTPTNLALMWTVDMTFKQYTVTKIL